ncbi:hypothetical protein QEG73_17130 [Chitinophagaceae bacterium 26-R-25]|nr:hypothetical protein [Chitinophagaceae bacterium 26-R-25]
MINYHNKTFRSVENTPNGEVSGETTFHYKQNGNIVTATYSGGGIVEGHLIALITENGDLTMRYHHVNSQNVLMTGVCRSIPELLSNGKIRLHELWQWTSGDGSTGRSIVEEV